ncbi:MAG: Ribonuclease [Actinomycetota bacterium]
MTNHLIGYRSAAPVNRVGIIVTSKCGNAVVRNLLRRRTRAVARELIGDGLLTGDVVFRFRCEGNVPDFETLQNEIRQCATRWAA